MKEVLKNSAGEVDIRGIVVSQSRTPISINSETWCYIFYGEKYDIIEKE